MPFSYGIPIEAPGPLNEVTNPTVRSAATPPPADNSSAARPTHKRENMTDLLEMSSGQGGELF
jgi:hypothetical protein